MTNYKLHMACTGPEHHWARDPHAVWAGMDERFLYQYNVQTQHSSHQPLMMENEKVFEMSDAISQWHGKSLEKISIYTNVIKASNDT
jgi:hypothetical protein